MSDEIVGRSFGSITKATKEDNGDWTVLVSMIETRTKKGMEEEKQEIVAQCTNSSFEDAYAVAMNSTLSQFNDRILETKTNSLFSAEGKE
jgi:hypothetical protein